MRAAQRRGAIYGARTTWNARQGRRRGQRGVGSSDSVHAGHELEEGDNPDMQAQRVSEIGERGKGAERLVLGWAAGRGNRSRACGETRSSYEGKRRKTGPPAELRVGEAERLSQQAEKRRGGRKILSLFLF